MYGYDSFTPDSRQAPVALTFDQQTKNTLAIYGFYFSGPCALDLSPTGPKINRSPLLNKDIHYMKALGEKERLLLSGMCSLMGPL